MIQLVAEYKETLKLEESLSTDSYGMLQTQTQADEQQVKSPNKLNYFSAKKWMQLEIIGKQ